MVSKPLEGSKYFFGGFEMIKDKGVKILSVTLVLLASASFMLYAGGSQGGGTSSGGQVEVTFWDMPIGSTDYPAEAERVFAKISETYPNIKGKYQSVPWANRVQTFSAAVASNTLPDMSTGAGFQMFLYHKQILALDSIIEEWRADGTLKNYQMDLIEYFRFKGQQVGIPRNVEPRYIVYRYDWFERDGIKPPTNWTELYNAAVHFTDKSKGTYGVVLPCAGSAANVMTNMLWAMNGSGYMAADGKTPDFVNRKNIEAMDFVRKLRDAGCFPEGMAAYETNEVTQIAAQDKVAIVFVTGGAQGWEMKQAGLDKKFKILAPPAGPSAGGKAGYVAALNAVMGYNTTKHPEETKKAIKWWADTIWQFWQRPEMGISGLPTRNDWVNDPKFLSTLTDPFMADFIKICLPSMHNLIFPATSLVPEGWVTMGAIDGERWTNEIIGKVLTSSATTQQIMQEYQAKAVQAFKDNAE
jgi:multiple sugar transport system substrate-binding protein